MPTFVLADVLADFIQLRRLRRHSKGLRLIDTWAILLLYTETVVTSISPEKTSWLLYMVRHQYRSLDNLRGPDGKRQVGGGSVSGTRNSWQHSLTVSSFEASFDARL